MVCPVTEAMDYGPNSTPLTGTKQSRSVYLPAGCDWYDFWTGNRYTGGQTVEAAAPLEIMPLFVRAGSILLLGPQVQYSAEQPGADWELRIYPGADGMFDLYEDEGDSYRYEEGAFAWTPIAWDDAARTLTFGAREGGFAGMVAQRTFNIVLVSEGHGVDIEPELHADSIIAYAGVLINLYVPTPSA
jgi:alpha-D-xyloside xylohydrolase